MSASDDQSEKECPLCMETFDLDDINFYPCKCEYQICRFCWHRLRTDENGLCPACRQEYPEDPVNFKPLTPEEFQRIKNEKKQREQQKKQKISDNRKHLAKVRVLQKNLVFVIGLPPRYCEPDLLKRTEYFGKFGKVHKVVINGNTSYAGPSGPSAGIFITYFRPEDALRAIQNVNAVQIDGRCVKASLGTTKYCSNFLRNQPCHKPDCMYLHDIGDEAASFTKEDMQQHKHTEYERRLHEQILPPLQSNRRVRDSSIQREVWPAMPENENAAGQQRSSEPTSVAETTNATNQNQNSSGKHSSQCHGTTRTRQGGRNRRQNRGTTAAAGTQKHRGDTKHRASPPAASVSPDRNGRSLPPAMFSSASTQGLSINNGNGGDSSTQSTSSSPSLFSSSLPNGGGPPIEIPHFGSSKGLNGEVVTATMTAAESGEIDIENDDERSTSKSPSVDGVLKQANGSDIHPQQPVCDSGLLADKAKINGVDDNAYKLSALFSKLLCDENADVMSFIGDDFGPKHANVDIFSNRLQCSTEPSEDWHTALGLKKEPQDDDLGFDPYMESAKGLEEMMREEKELTKRQPPMQHQQTESAPLGHGAVPPWDYRGRFRLPPQHQHQHQHLPRPGHIVRPSTANWHPSGNVMANSQFGDNRPHGPFVPQSPPENHIPARMEFVNSNFGPPPGFGSDLSPHKMNGVGSYPQGMHSFGQMRQQPQSKDAFNLKEWQDGFRAILPNVNIKFAPNLSASHHSPVNGPPHIDPPAFAQKCGWPVTSGAASRPTSDNNMFMFNRPPPPLVTNCSYPPPAGITRSLTVDATASVPPIRINAPQQLPFARALSPFRHDFMNWPLDDLSPTSHPPPGFTAPPSQQNVA